MLAGGDNFFVSGVGSAHQDVVFDSTREESRFLLNNTDLASPPVELDVLEIDTVDLNGTGEGIVQALNETDEGGLAATRLTREGDVITSLDVEGNISEESFVETSRIREGDVLEGDVALQVVEFLASGEGIDLGLTIENFPDLVGGAFSFEDGRNRREDKTKTEGTHEDGEEDGGDFSDAAVTFVDQPRSKPESESVGSEHDTISDTDTGDGGEFLLDTMTGCFVERFFEALDLAVFTTEGLDGTDVLHYFIGDVAGASVVSAGFLCGVFKNFGEPSASTSDEGKRTEHNESEAPRAVEAKTEAEEEHAEVVDASGELVVDAVADDGDVTEEAG